MQKRILILKKSIVHMLLGLIIVILSYLSITSMNSTVYLSEYERCFYCKDNPFVHIGFIILTILLFICTRRFFLNQLKKINVLPWAIIIICIYATVQFFVLFHIQLLPIFDQNHVYQIATRITNHNYSDFFKGQYGEKWTNQWGYLLFLMTAFRLLRSSNPNNIYVINIVFMTGIVWETYGFAKRYIKQKSDVGLMATCLFIPLWSFSTFLYGNIPACFFCILSLNMLYDFFEKNDLLKGILSALFIVVSVMLKTTQLIFFIAFIIYLLMQDFSNDKSKGMIKRIIVLILCILLYLFSGKCIHIYMEHMTGMSLGEGVPRIAHIAMAMHETGDSSGWYDGYIDTIYEDSGFDIELTRKEATADLKNSLQKIRSNPSGAVGFYSRKVLSQWIEPTYESILILLNRHAYTDAPQYPVNALPTNLMGAMLTQIMNFMQTLIYFGAFVFYADIGIGLLRCRNNGEYRTLLYDYINYLLPALVLLGGFAFYIFWEANSQYALFFVFLLIPCAMSGYSTAADHIIDTLRYRSLKNGKSFWKPVAAILLITIIVFFFPEGSIIERMLAPSWSSDQYKSYMSEMLEAGVEEYNPITDISYSVTATGYDDKGRARFQAGRYYIRSAFDRELYLVPENDTAESQVIIGNASDNRTILTSTKKGYMFRFQSTQKVMDVENASTLPGTRVKQYESNGDPSQIFSFEPSDDGTFWITYSEALVLTAHEDGRVTVESKEDGNPLQLWEITAE